MDQIKETTESAEQTRKVYLLVIEHIKTLIQREEISFGGKLPSERHGYGSAWGKLLRDFYG